MAIRFVAWTRTVVLFNDGPVFLSMAEAIGEGRWSAVLAHPYHPLYPFCIWLVSLLGVELETAAVAVSIAGGVGAVVAVQLLLRGAFGMRLAWIGSGLAALHPTAIDVSSDVMSDGLYSGLLLGGFAVLVRAVRGPSTVAAAGAGALAGLAYWVRPEGLGLLPVGVALFLWRGLRGRGERRRVLAATSILLVVGGLVASPYVLALERQTGELALTRKKSVRTLVLGETVAPGPEERRASIVPEAAEERIVSAPPLVLPELAIRADGPGARRPPRTLGGAFEAGLRVLRTALSAFRYELVLLAVWGLVASRRRRKEVSGRRCRSLRWATRAMLVMTLLYGGLLVLLVWGAGYVSRRHALPFLLPWLGFAAVAGRELLRTGLGAGRAARDGAAAGWGRRSISLALIAGLLVGWGVRDLRLRGGDRMALREAAEWLGRSHPDSGPVAGQKLRVAYYAGAPFVPLPPGRDGTLESSLRARGARWIVIDEGKLGDHLGLSEGIGGWLRPRHRVEASGHAAWVLEIQPEAAP